MEAYQVGGSVSPHGGRATEAQSPSVPHRPRLVDGDRALCTTDQQAEHESRRRRELHLRYVGPPVHTR